MEASHLPNNENNYARTQNQVREILVVSFGGTVPQFTFLDACLKLGMLQKTL